MAHAEALLNPIRYVAISKLGRNSELTDDLMVSANITRHVLEWWFKLSHDSFCHDPSRVLFCQAVFSLTFYIGNRIAGAYSNQPTNFQELFLKSLVHQLIKEFPDFMVHYRIHISPPSAPFLSVRLPQSLSTHSTC
jgi:hypothetical protein